MTDDEMRQLVALVAEELRRLGVRSAPAASASPWLPPPVRPDPPARGHPLPEWTGAAQSLGDVAPGSRGAASRHRDDIGAATQAIRAAAAGKPTSSGNRASPRSDVVSTRGGAASPAATRRRRAFPIEVPVAVSNRHVHLSEPDCRRLFGVAVLTARRQLSQPGQFAAQETVTLEGPDGRIDHVRVVGPPRGATQVEIASSDARRLGIAPPVAVSGSLDASVGITVVGPNGRLPLSRGVIIAARHLHLAPSDASRWGLADGDRVVARCGDGSRAVTFHHVAVRTGAGHATELHLDVDEAHAAGLPGGGRATLVDWAPAAGPRRVLVTERDLLEIVRRGASLPAGALLTPSARDRARVLGLELP